MDQVTTLLPDRISSYHAYSNNLLRPVRAIALFTSVSDTKLTALSRRRPTPEWEILRFAMVLAFAFCSMLGAWRYVLTLSPEVDLYTFAAHKKIAYARKLDEGGPPKTVICGGSSCAFGVNADRMQEAFYLRAVNFRMHASMGVVVIIALALQYTRGYFNCLCGASIIKWAIHLAGFRRSDKLFAFSMFSAATEERPTGVVGQRLSR
jgi:hypothetical protein